MLPDELKVGSPLPELAGQARWDYSYLLPELYRARFRLEVRTCPGWDGPLWVKLMDTTGEGYRSGAIDADIKRARVYIGVVELEYNLRGKRIGRAMYLATIIHAHRVHGCTVVMGGDHSLQAHRVHASLCIEFGFTGYRPDRWLSGRHGEYKYRIAKPRNLSGVCRPLASRLS